MIASYRDPRYAASLRIQQLRERERDVTELVPGELAQIRGRRLARTLAGAVAIVGFLVTALAAVARATGPIGWRGDLHSTSFLFGAVVLSLVTYVITRAVVPYVFERRVWSSFDASEDELSRAARLESGGVRLAAARLAGAGERASIAVPMAGAGLLMPLALHLLVWCFIGKGDIGSERWLADFDWWIGASLILVGVAHVVLALLCNRFADKIDEASLSELALKSPMSGWSVLGWTVLASCVPGLVAIAIPPIVVLLTGMLFIPAMFHTMRRRIIDERTALDFA